MRYRWLIFLAIVAGLIGIVFGWIHANAPSPQSHATSTADLGILLLEDENGVSVLAVRDGSIAEQAGIHPADRLLQVNGGPINTVEELEALLQRSAASSLNVSILRADEPMIVQIAVDSALD